MPVLGEMRMSFSDKMYYAIFATAFIVALASFITLISPSYKKVVSIKLALFSILMTPIVQLGLFVIALQVYAAEITGEVYHGFACSGFHGGGLNSDCSFYEAVFEGAIVAVIYSFATFGVVPLAIFLSLLVILVLIKKGFSS